MSSNLLPTDIDLDGSEIGRPKHEVLKEYFVQAMQSGRMAPGSPLPTEQSLAESLGIARSTVRQALGALEQDGLIRRVQGKGTFVHEKVSQRLKSGTGYLALIVTNTRGGFFPSLLYGFEVASRDSQYQVIVSNSENNVDKQGNAILHLIDKQVAGVFIEPTTIPITPAYQIRQLQQHNIPVVFCHRGVEGIQAPVLSLPHERLGYLAGNTLVKSGHRHIAFFATHHCHPAENMCCGLRNSLHEVGADLCEKQDVWYGSSSAILELEKEIPKALESILTRKNRPTAIFASYDSLAEIIYFHLASLGVRIPEDISLIGVGGAWREGTFERRLTSVVVDENATARHAVDLIKEMCDGKRAITDDQMHELPLGVSTGQTILDGPSVKL